MNGPHRVNIEQKAINSLVDQTNEGVTVKVMLSLFDVPESAFADFDQDKRIICFDFDYIGGEEVSIEKPIGHAISLVLGKSSNRLYGIRVAVDELPQMEAGKSGSELVINVVEDNVEEYRRAHPMRSRSFEAVNRVLKEYSAELEPVVQRALVTP